LNLDLVADPNTDLVMIMKSGRVRKSTLRP
jgi:hypothetical protein